MEWCRLVVATRGELVAVGWRDGGVPGVGGYTGGKETEAGEAWDVVLSLMSEGAGTGAGAEAGPGPGPGEEERAGGAEAGAGQGSREGAGEGARAGEGAGAREARARQVLAALCARRLAGYTGEKRAEAVDSGGGGNYPSYESPGGGGTATGAVAAARVLASEVRALQGALTSLARGR